MSDTLYPTRYASRLVTIDQLFTEHHVDKMHPEFARRLRCWLEAQGGKVGIGGSWRDDGTQPDKPGFAPEGQSFHQYQKFASGLIKFAAVDLVVQEPGKIHRAPRWDEVPVQGSEWAKEYGVHANVGMPGQPGSESWHMQCVEQDGWQSWINAGSPDPVSNYPIPDGDLEMKIVNPPKRTFDSRTTGSKLAAGSVTSVSIPVQNIDAAFVNITVTNADAKGFITAWSGVGNRPNVSNVNYQAGESICNTSWVPVSGYNTIAIYTKSTCDIIVDLQATA